MSGELPPIRKSSCKSWNWPWISPKNDPFNLSIPTTSRYIHLDELTTDSNGASYRLNIRLFLENLTCLVNNNNKSLSRCKTPYTLLPCSFKCTFSHNFFISASGSCLQSESCAIQASTSATELTAVIVCMYVCIWVFLNKMCVNMNGLQFAYQGNVI